jgi:MFS family permease
MQDLIRKRPGVLSTRVGYSGGDVANATYWNHGTHPEAIEIVFDPEGTSYRELLEFFFQIHDPTTRNRQGNDVGTSYRSAIFFNMLGPSEEHPEGLLLPQPALQLLTNLVNIAAVIGLVVMMAAPFLRFRRASYHQRQQLKWVAYIALLSMLAAFAGIGLSRVLPAAGALGALGVLGIAVGIPVAVAVAILRHRLYDIDRLINRTLVYGLLTAILGLGYAGVVLILGELFGRAGAEPPSWAVAGATLAMAALFRPARGRIQAAVDRRFNRRKYNAATTIDAFSARLRDQVDLDTLTTELLAVTDKTMQPMTVSVWLRPPDEVSKAHAPAHAPRWDY